jgi:hypothetical protein
MKDGVMECGEIMHENATRKSIKINVGFKAPFRGLH